MTVENTTVISAPTTAATVPAVVPGTPVQAAPATGTRISPNMLATLKVLAKVAPAGMTRREIQFACDTTITGYAKLRPTGYVREGFGGGKNGAALLFYITQAGLDYLAALNTVTQASVPVAQPVVPVTPVIPAAPTPVTVAAPPAEVTAEPAKKTRKPAAKKTADKNGIAKL